MQYASSLDRQGLASHDSHQSSSSRHHCAVAISGLNTGNDYLVDDARGDRVRDLSFHPVPDFDAKAPVGRHDEQRFAVVECLAADLPTF